MDKNKIKLLVENCKLSSSNKVLESLLVIRNDVIRSGWGIQTLRECGGVEVLVSLLKKQKENILELALSTLGNCCMDEQASLDVGKLKATSQIVCIIKGLSKDKLIGRACRLLGNLAQQTTNAEQLFEDDAVPALITIINNADKTSSVQTLTMAVRAIRLLWMNTKRYEEMLSCGAVRSVAVLLCAECETAGFIGEEQSATPSKDFKDRDQLFKGLLKCLGQFTTAAHHKCAEQILGEGAGYKCLVVLCKNYEELASKCLVNLCYVGPSRPILGAAGAVECLINLMNAKKVYPECYLNAVCLLCREAVNRAKLRECGGLSILLNATKDTTQLSRHTSALRALLQFVFDDLSFQILIKEGLINVIEDQLTDYVKTMKCEHQQSKSTTSLKDVPTNSSRANKLENAMECSDSEEDACRIVIERDNMMIGFNDACSISEDDSDNECNVSSHSGKRSKKLDRNKNDGLRKMAKYDWSSSGISWEPKTDTSYNSLPNQSPLSGYSPTGSTSRSPDARSTRLSHVYARSNSKYEEDRPPEYILNEGCSYYSGSHWSPGSPNSLCYSSPYDDDSSDSEKSGRYSPVCSDVEEEKLQGERESEKEGHMANEMDDLMIDDETLSIEELEMEDSSFHQSKSHRVRCLLVLLSRASHSDFGVEYLASPMLLLALLSYVGNARNPVNRATRILITINGYAMHLIRLLKHRLVLHLYKMIHQPKHAECKQCVKLKTVSEMLITQLTMLAESDYGVGEISYQLQKGESNIKQSIALTLPYIIKAQKPLKKFLVHCKAFDLLFAMMSCGKEPLEYMVPSLSQLAHSFHIKDPKTLENLFSNETELKYQSKLEQLQPKDIVCIQLDDGSCVQADKQFLCQQSDVFNAMFTGSFKESSEPSVQLKNISKDSLEYLITLLNCGLNNKDVTLDCFPLPDRLSTSLETLLLADKYLMDKLKSLLFSAIVQFKLMFETASELYMWSLEKGMGLLCVETVAFILTGDMTDSQRLQIVSSILNTKYRHQLLDDVKGILIRHFK